MVDLINEKNKQQEELSGDVLYSFDPASLGFREYIPRRFVGPRSLQDKDYIVFKRGTAHMKQQMFISIGSDTAEFLHDMFGDRISVYANDKGQILITEGSRVTLGKPSKTGRRRVYISGLSDELFAVNGKFKRLGLIAKPYGGFKAVLFVPNGEKVE